MDARDVTRSVLIATVIILVAYDLAVLMIAGPRASISVVLYEDSRKYPIIAGAIFLVIGHIFWPVWSDQ